MRRALICLSLLHGATLLSLAWIYTGDDTTLTADERSFGAVMLALAGALMLIGTLVIPRTPALATVPFGLAALLTVLVRTSGHAYLLAYAAWALVLTLGAIAVARDQRRQAHLAEPPPIPADAAAGLDPELLPVATASPEEPEAVGIARDLLRQIPRYHRRRQSRTRHTGGGARPRQQPPRVAPVTRPQPAAIIGASGGE